MTSKDIQKFLEEHSSKPSQESIDKMNARKEYRKAIEEAIKENGLNEEEAKAFKLGIIWQRLQEANYKKLGQKINNFLGIHPELKQ